MMRVLALLAMIALPFAAVVVPSGAAAEGVAEQAQAASAELQAAVAALEAAVAAKDRVSALTRTIRAYEAGQAALREALRQAELREAVLTLQFAAKRDRVAQLLAVLGQLGAEPGPLLLLHPGGPLGSVRSGMLLADVTPALQAEAGLLGAELRALADIRALQQQAGETLGAGLQAAQAARSALSQAISDRTELPRRFTEDPQVLRGLLESADTLEAFAGGLALDDNGFTGFADARGLLDLPVLGTLLLAPGEADAAGVTRPGMTLATRPGALVTTPWPATIRYRGPLLDYGNVMILEPGGGYLLIVAGLEQVYGEVGEVIAQDAPLGLMGGAPAKPGATGGGAGGGLADFAASDNEAGARGTETLYLELRQGAAPVDPMEWFRATAKAKE